MDNCVQVQIAENIATITLNRPAVANALSIALLHELQRVLHDISYHPTIRVVIVTGAGDKAFCAGADLKERQTMDDAQTRQTIALIGATVSQFEQLSQPVIAAINGIAVGGGLELALACDIRIASRHAVVGLTETALGIIPGAGGTQRLPRLIGIGKAKELIYTARRISATDALQYQLVEYVVEPDQLLERATELAQEIAQNAPLSLKQVKTAINAGMQTDITTGLNIEALAYSRVLYSEDRLEGLQAFAEKRKPQYKGQ